MLVVVVAVAVAAGGDDDDDVLSGVDISVVAAAVVVTAVSAAAADESPVVVVAVGAVSSMSVEKTVGSGFSDARFLMLRRCKRGNTLPLPNSVRNGGSSAPSGPRPASRHVKNCRRCEPLGNRMGGCWMPSWPTSTIDAPPLEHDELLRRIMVFPAFVVVVGIGVAMSSAALDGINSEDDWWQCK